MDSLFILIPVAIIFVAIAIKVFFWAVDNGQYDDLETEGRRILFDDDLPRDEPNGKDEVGKVTAGQETADDKQEPQDGAAKPDQVEDDK
ncbi:cbb3-type cytochrome oxidase assembly protein CcoS [Biformimicrobium ophioploci]|uniref:Cbb3-type cytochrome oxidase assembly protein CcoS n=1 Tax=Biformimicrobium ophioploci TaxID=3036711 RepID=A0ABQ6LXI3_9GAMM|nr:cbb3-type cytochrome oxidase assembly protein CcoS [Microbulbifer sp. NKW57]GMG86807.1 hypothetical protein MNKW57_11280 [Microbulbifer sp. NKW57]